MDVYRFSVYINSNNEIEEKIEFIDYSNSLRFPLEFNIIHKHNIFKGYSTKYYYKNENELTDEIKNQMYEIALDYIEKRKIKIEKKIEFYKNKIQVLENMKKHKRIVNLFRKQKFKKII